MPVSHELKCRLVATSAVPVLVYASWNLCVSGKSVARMRAAMIDSIYRGIFGGPRCPEVVLSAMVPGHRCDP
eukprot:46859-Amphidinium_carterae.1